MSLVAIESLAYPAVLGAAVAYSMYNTQPIPLLVGAAVGAFAYAPINVAAVGLPLPPVISSAVPEIVSGAVIGYNMYGGLVYAAAGAAAGVALKYALVKL